MTSLSYFFTKVYFQIRRRWLYGLIASLISVGIVMATPQPGQTISWLDLIIRGVQVIQLSNLSDRQEIALGEQINQQLMQQEFQIYNGDPAINEYVDEIAQRLAPHSNRPEIPYIFQVVESDQVNAFATMGGYGYITTELMRTAKNEAELASVIGHEMGHIVERHAVEQMREAAIAQGVATATGLDQSTAVAIGVELVLRRPNSRRDELQADAEGLTNITRAGYAPIAMVTFMEKLLDQPSIPSILSTHPATSTRIRELNEQIDAETASVGDGLDEAAYTARIGSLL
jgi:beta-barrel assembly-enhancing protease